ncbi:MAG: ImmA/IrrE family metallo-endopeptidase [Candidatus Saccharibacteria bacterium]|nr:ImmA/IrrE family metallo-endopeptidase [Candidatus Saccharibacteria bacterium]
MKKLLTKLRTHYPHITFVEGEHFYWSPGSATVTYCFDSENDKQRITLLHELAHALLEHTTFTTDFELLRIEVTAWRKAQELGKRYAVNIPEEHIEKCLDTYRDWLHSRSTCPDCLNNGIQAKSDRLYRCPNCRQTWKVSTSRLCRPYRQVATTK